MVIHQMTVEECHIALAQTSLARIACEWRGEPYVVPVYLLYDSNSLYGFATPGQKIEWMRANPRVCVEIDNVENPDRWMSVVVQGTYEELSYTPEHEGACAHAHALLSRRATWWEPASVAAGHPFVPIFYRIRPQRITGRRASPDPARGQIASPAPARNWLHRLMAATLGRKLSDRTRDSLRSSARDRRGLP
jgi:nitroimidazol reductase NimA-like FMN-containing flavoprotein (pyridoxamine 5'-phosphate oxidase superfamily)